MKLFSVIRHCVMSGLRSVNLLSDEYMMNDDDDDDDDDDEVV